MLLSLPHLVPLMLRPATSWFNRSWGHSYCVYCRGVKAIDELTTGLLLRPEETAMLVQAAGMHTGKAGLVKKEPMLELLLRRLATAIEAFGILSRKR